MWIDFTEWHEESRIIQVHALMAFAGVLIGAAALTATKGSATHKLFGRVFGLLALAVAISGFGIHEIRAWGLWSWIHLLSVLTVILVIVGVWSIRRRNVGRHQRVMRFVYVSGFVIAFGFTLAPGRMPAEMFLEQPAIALTGSDTILWIFPIALSAVGLWVLRQDIRSLFGLRAGPDKA